MKSRVHTQSFENVTTAVLPVMATWPTRGREAGYGSRNRYCADVVRDGSSAWGKVAEVKHLSSKDEISRPHPIIRKRDHSRASGDGDLAHAGAEGADRLAA